MPRVVVNQEFPPSKLAVLVRDKDDNLIGRWAEDEAKIQNVPQNISKTGDMPGGHGEFSCSLARDPKQSWPDLSLFSKIELQAAGGERVWTGSIWQEPQSDGERQAIEVKALGDKQLLEDDETVVGPGFIDRDLTKWGETSAARRLSLAAFVDPSAISTTTRPVGASDVAAALMFEINALKEGVEERGELAYDGGGPELGKILYTFLGRPVGNHDSDYLTRLVLSVDGVQENVPGPEHDAEGAAQDAVETSAVGLKYALAQVAYGGGFVEDPYGPEVFGFQNVSVIGRDAAGLALAGGFPSVGFFANQMIPGIVEGSGLRTNPELLEDDGFIITQAWFADPGTRMSKLVEVTKYGLLDWFVFNDRILQYRKSGTYGRKWRLSPGSAPKNSGPDASRVFDRLTVTWQDVDGTTKRAKIGPLTDERNPAVAAGRPRGKLLALNGVCTESLAIRTGERFLEEVRNLTQSGETTITGYIQDQYGTWYPASYVQPGDEVTPAGSTNYRRITSVSYSHDGKSANVTLDAPKDGFEALEARMNARLLELGLG